MNPIQFHMKLTWGVVEWTLIVVVTSLFILIKMKTDSVDDENSSSSMIKNMELKMTLSETGKESNSRNSQGISDFYIQGNSSTWRS